MCICRKPNILLYNSSYQRQQRKVESQTMLIKGTIELEFVNSVAFWNKVRPTDETEEIEETESDMQPYLANHPVKR